MTAAKTVKILVLDGGGMRGYLSALFLERFLTQAGISANEVWKNFDIIAGTSIGGIQACGYANGLSPVDLKNFFVTKGPWIFTIRTAIDVASGSINSSEASNRPNTLQKIAMLTTSDPFYKAVDPASNYGDSRLKTELDGVFSTKIMTDLKTNVLITSYNKDTDTPIIWSNCTVPGYLGETELVKNVVLSTGSAPTYFPPANWNLINYIDGGVIQNNPASLALSLGQMLYPNAMRYCVLSVGAGLGDIGFHEPTMKEHLKEFRENPVNFAKKYDISAKQLKAIDNLGAFEGIKDLFSLISIGIAGPQEIVHKVLEYQSTLTNQNLSYYRFQVILDPLQDNELDRSDADFFPYLESLMNTQYDLDMVKISQFINMMTPGVCNA
jgi:predicted acylesterase/phospholipase RssA